MKSTLKRRDLLKLVMLGGAVVPTLASCATAPQGLGTLSIVTRAEWGAVEPQIATSVEGVYDPHSNPGGWYRYEKPLAEVLTTIVVHHSALPLSDGVLEIQEKHMTDKRYADIGYHFVIDEAGIIYEGRPLDVRGAHTGGHNTGTVGIVLLGNFEEGNPLAIQLQRLTDLSLALIADYGITHLAGHRDFQPDETVCPGHHLETLLQEFAKTVGLEFGTNGYVAPTLNS
jgi:hypothetical protein